MIRGLGPGDEPAIDAFLAGHAGSSMFLRSNLRAAGIVDRGEAYQGAWVGAFEDGALVGVACHAWNGMILMQAPVSLPALVDAAVGASGRAIAGLSGVWGQVEAARSHLGLADRPTALDGAEDLFELPLDRLVVPAGRAAVRRAVDADLARLTDWRAAYSREIGIELGPERARSAVAGLIGAGNLFVAEEDGRTVAMSAFNAVLPDTVQIGGVYTPPDDRCRGHGRAVVAGSLVLARSGGTERAILFTDRGNVGAQRAYRAIGFEVVGDYGVVVFR